MFTRESILGILLSIPGLLLAISMHEAAHGYAAYFMGDNTAKYQGRLSLNPLHHLDPMGALCMLLFRFGWAKPVPINPFHFRNRRLGIIVVSLAGPLANFLLGFISTVLYYAMAYLGTVFAGFSAPAEFLMLIFQMSVYMNVGLMIFNLIPIPPLDGSKILLEFLPYHAKETIYRYERYFGMILIILVYVGTLTPVLGFFQSFIIRFYDFVCKLIFGLFI